VGPCLPHGHHAVPSRDRRAHDRRCRLSQGALFDDLPEPVPTNLPEGLVYEAEFLSRDEEQAIIATIRALPLEAARYKEYTARRRVVSFGGSYDFDANKLLPAQPLIEALQPLRARVARWAGVAPEALHHVLVAEYAPGTPLGWHRDVPDHEAVFGVSLGSTAVLRFRPFPPVAPKRADIVKLRATPRSIYAMRGPARWGWQHSVAPVDELRWSITLRTARS
jgi:alkylated DNA repair dioxygenase AlkB